jgi:hypothetical protein
VEASAIKMLCISIVKSTGKQCTNTAKFRLEDGGHCGTHTPAGKRIDSNLIGSITIRRVQNNLEAVHRELFEAVKRRIETNDPSINFDFAERILSIEKLESTRFSIIMNRAIEIAGGSDDIPKVAESLFTALTKYSETLSQKRISVGEELVPWCVEKGVSFKSRLNDPHLFLNETAYCIEYPEYEMRIINCKPQYIRSEGYENFSAWLKDEKNVYMGPAYAISERRSLSLLQLPEEDSPWYIKLPSNVRLRSTHNAIVAKKIIEDIESGKEDPEKYLDLLGKTLGCVCMPYPCHCQVYIEVIRALERMENEAQKK